MNCKNLLFFAFLALTFGLSAQSWDVLDGSALPTDSTPAFDESCNEPGPNTSATIVADPDIPGNQLLEYLSPDPDGRMAYKLDFDDWSSSEFTLAIRMRGYADIDTLSQLFDIEIRYGNAGVREKLFVNYDNTIELDNADVSANLGFDVSGWHLYRVAMSGDQVNVYIDEESTPVISGVTTNSTSDLQLKIADCSGGNSQGAVVDWVIWTTDGAYAPGEGPAIPAGLETGAGDSFDPSQYRIAFLTKDVTDEGFLEEAGLIADLRQRGFEVDVTYNDPNDIVVEPDFEFSYAALEGYDLVVIGRGVSSGDFTEPAEWAAVETPVVIFSAYLPRSTRLNLINSSSASREVDDGTTVDMDRVSNITIQDHPVFTGLDENMDEEIEYHTWFYDYIEYGADTFEINHNAALLGAWQVAGGPGDNNVAMALWDAGVETYPGSGTTISGARAFFLMGSDDSSSPKIRNFTAFTQESTVAFHNLIKLLVGAEPDGVEIPLSGPAARYSMEGTGEVVTDGVGSAQGMIMSGNGITREDCGVGNSINFAGSTKPEAVIWVEDNPAINFNGSSNFAVSAWVKIDPHANTGEMNILLKGDNKNDGTGLPDGNGHWYALATKDNELRFAIDDDVTKTQLGVAIDDTNFPAAEWNHVVGVRDNSQDSLFLYLNGVKVGSILDETDGDLSTDNLPLVIGNYHSGVRKINGSIDEVEIWDRALDAATISEMYNNADPSSDCSVLETIIEASDDATLSSLTVSVGTLEPAFDPGIPNYSVEVPEGTSSVTITALANDDNAVVSGDGEFTGIPGTATVSVVAEDGEAMQDYSISFSIEGAGNQRIEVEPGFGTLTEALAMANPGDTLVLQNGGEYSPVESYDIGKHIVIVAEEIPELPALANMPVINNLFGVSPLFQMNFGGDLVLIGIDVNGGDAANIIDCQGENGVPSTQSIYINRCRLHNTTDDILNDARDADTDMTALERCIVRNTFIYDSGAGHGLYVKNYHGEGTFIFENLTFWDLGQQFNWMRHYPVGITQTFVYDHMTGYNMSTDEGANKELFGNSDGDNEADLDIMFKNNILHTQVSTNEGSLKFDNTSESNTITTKNNVLFQVQPIFDLGGTINHIGNMIDVDPMFADPDNGDFTVNNSDLWDAADDGEIVGALYWHPDFVDDFSDINTDVDEFVEATVVGLKSYPNPFNNNTNISFHLRHAADVMLSIHDLTGRTLKTVVNEKLPAGDHVKEVALGQLAPGAYVYRFVSNGVVISRLMVKAGGQ